MATQEPVISAVQLASPAQARLIGWMTSHWWMAFSLSSICVVGGHLTIKAGLNAAAREAQTPGTLSHVFHLVTQPEVVAGLCVYLVGTACWMLAVSQKEISFLYPLASVNYVLVAVASAALLAESLPPRRMGGIALVVGGIILLNRKSRRVRK